MAATSLSGETFASSNSMRACALSKLTSARLTPGSLSKAVATETGQALQTIPFTSMTATFGAAAEIDAAARSERDASNPSSIRRLMPLLLRASYMPAAT